MVFARLGFLLLSVTLSGAAVIAATESSSYRAAVYEHRVLYNPLVRVPHWQLVDANLDVYDQQATEASLQGAQIIVFPENGILGLSNHRSSIRPFLESMPDPKKTAPWTPCDQPTAYGASPILRRLSCTAKANRIYVVANMGEVQPCSHALDPNCPADGAYQFNTDVAFDRNGTLVAKYRKCHLYAEPEFDTAAPCEAQTFETDFAGTFGLFTCFDMLFQSPAVDLVHRGVKNFAFPTAWMDAAPLMSAVQTQMGWSTGYDVNLLAANLHRPEGRFHGSGIYSGRRASPVFYYNETLNAARLLVAAVPLVHAVALPIPIGRRAPAVSHDDAARHDAHSVVAAAQPPTSNGRSADGTTLNLIINGDKHNAVLLLPSQRAAHVCHNELCCSAAFQMSSAPSDSFILGAFSDHHKDRFMQVCTLLACSNASSSTCTKLTTAATTFSLLSLSGNFTTQHVYPSVLLDGIVLADFAEWTYSSQHATRIHSPAGFAKPLLVASLLGRWFERD